MNNPRIRVRGGGDIRIRRSWWSSPQLEAEPGRAPDPGRPPPSRGEPESSRALTLDWLALERAEIVTEGVFRPGVDDVEVKYIMSGSTPNRIDQVHALSSDMVIPEATSRSVMTNVGRLIELLKRVGAADTALIVDIHTHPSGIPEPSDQDKKAWSNMGRDLAEEFPSAMILFGVHAVGPSATEFLQRKAPDRVAVNTVAWRSNTRDHKVALFTPDARPVEVRADG